MILLFVLQWSASKIYPYIFNWQRQQFPCPGQSSPPKYPSRLTAEQAERSEARARASGHPRASSNRSKQRISPDNLLGGLGGHPQQRTSPDSGATEQSE